MLRPNFVYSLTVSFCIPCSLDFRNACPHRGISVLHFFMSLFGIRDVYFQGLPCGLTDASEAFIFSLALEILPCFNSENGRKYVPGAGDTGGRCQMFLSLKHGLASPTWKCGASHPFHTVRPEGTAVLCGLPASRAVSICVPGHWWRPCPSQENWLVLVPGSYIWLV